MANFYNTLSLFDSQEIEFVPKIFSQKFDAALKFKKGVKLGEEYNVMVRNSQEDLDESKMDMSLSMQSDLNVSGAGYMLRKPEK